MIRAGVAERGAGRSLRWTRVRDAAAPVLLTATALIGAAVMLVPFLWAVMTSLKPMAEISLLPPTWLPRQLSFEGYTMAWTTGRVWVGVQNSLIVSASSTL